MKEAYGIIRKVTKCRKKGGQDSIMHRAYNDGTLVWG